MKMKMKKKISVICIALLLWCNIAGALDFEDIKESDFYPESFSISTDYNPDKNRSWTFHEYSAGFGWKFKNKSHWLMPDGFKLSADYASDHKRDWQFREIEGGVTWKLK